MRNSKIPASQPGSELTPHRFILAQANELATNSEKTVHNLTIGNPTALPSLQVLESRAEKVNDFYISSSGYTDFGGHKALRNKVAQFFKEQYPKYDLSLDADNVIFTVGAQEAMDTAIKLADGPVILPGPVFTPYHNVVNNHSKDTIWYDTTTYNYRISGELGGKLDRVLEEKFQQSTIEDRHNFSATIILTDPGNPTGYKQSKEDLDSLAQLLRVKWQNVRVISDSLYLGLTYKPEQKYSFLDAALASNSEQLLDRVLYVDSCSKVDSFPAARAGYAFSTSKELINKMSAKILTSTVHSPIESQLLVAECLKARHSYAEHNAQFYEERAKAFAQSLSGQNILQTEPNASFYMILDLGFMRNLEVSPAVRSAAAQYFGSDKAVEIILANDGKVGNDPMIAALELLYKSNIATVPILPPIESQYLKIYSEDQQQQQKCEVRIVATQEPHIMQQIGKDILGLKQRLELIDKVRSEVPSYREIINKEDLQSPASTGFER